MTLNLFLLLVNAFFTGAWLAILMEGNTPERKKQAAWWFVLWLFLFVSRLVFTFYVP